MGEQEAPADVTVYVRIESENLDEMTGGSKCSKSR